MIFKDGVHRRKTDCILGQCSVADFKNVSDNEKL